MKAKDFKKSNRLIAETNQPEYTTLPAHVSKGIVTTCWKATLKERIIFLFYGKIWLQTMTRSEPLQPLKMAINQPDLTL